MKHLITFLLLIITNTSRASIALEADPIAYALEGHSLHILYDTDSGIRFDIGTFSLNLNEKKLLIILFKYFLIR